MTSAMASGFNMLAASSNASNHWSDVIGTFVLTEVDSGALSKRPELTLATRSLDGDELDELLLQLPLRLPAGGRLRLRPWLLRDLDLGL
mmetsp:Transcript_60643/g.114482  ORF Transcript_60643/g.114482 Transcript_60643/m.114482 type:complete len:89 (-) Transcript_60643:142-408(-)